MTTELALYPFSGLLGFFKIHLHLFQTVNNINPSSSMRKHTLTFSILILGISAAFAQVIPQQLEYDGYLLEGGKPVTGNRTIAVKVYDKSTGGIVSYTETIGTVKITNGEFYIKYGAAGSGIASALTTNQTWLAILVNNIEQIPRIQLLSVPYSLRSADAQAVKSNLQNVVTAFGNLVTAFGGNASSITSNPQAAVATLQSIAKDILDIRRKSQIVTLSGSSVAEANRSYVVAADTSVNLTLPSNPKVGDLVTIFGDGAAISAPAGSVIIDGLTPFEINLPTIGNVTSSNPGMSPALAFSDNLQVIYSAVSNPQNPSSQYLARSLDGGQTWISLFQVSGPSMLDGLNCSGDGSKFVCSHGNDPQQSNWKLYSNFGNSSLTLPNQTNFGGSERILISRNGNRLFAFSNQKLFVSDNNGTTWNATTSKIGTTDIQFDTGAGFSKSRFSASANGSTIVFIANLGNGFRPIVSRDSGKTWSSSPNLPNNSWQGFENVFISDDGNRIFSLNPQVPTSKLIYSEDRGLTWKTKSFLSNFRTTLGTLLASTSGKNLFYGNYYSIDYGLNWKKVFYNLDYMVENDFRPLAISSDGYRKIYSLGSGSTQNLQKTWTTKIYSKGNLQLVYVGSGNWITSNRQDLADIP